MRRWNIKSEATSKRAKRRKIRVLSHGRDFSRLCEGGLKWKRKTQEFLIIWIHDKYTKRNRPIRIDKFLSEEEVGINLYECPVCGNILSDDVYCRYCGQALEREDIYDK